MRWEWTFQRPRTIGASSSVCFRRRKKSSSSRRGSAWYWIAAFLTPRWAMSRPCGISYIDQQRLDQYLESIRGVEQRLTDRDALLERGRPEFDEQGVRLQPQGKSGMQEHIEMMMDLVALAFQTDKTRVATQVLGGEAGPNYEEYKDWAAKAGGQLHGAHDLHHKGSQGVIDSPDTKVLSYRDELYCACLARLMDKLKGIPAREGTLLDHTVLLMGGSQISSHSGGSFPMLLRH